MGFASDFAEKIAVIWVHAMVRPKPVRPSSRPGSSWFILGESSLLWPKNSGEWNMIIYPDVWWMNGGKKSWFFIIFFDYGWWIYFEWWVFTQMGVDYGEIYPDSMGWWFCFFLVLSDFIPFRRTSLDSQAPAVSLTSCIRCFLFGMQLGYMIAGK